jgi:hypothetical protein
MGHGVGGTAGRPSLGCRRAIEKHRISGLFLQLTLLGADEQEILLTGGGGHHLILLIL